MNLLQTHGPHHSENTIINTINNTIQFWRLYNTITNVFNILTISVFDTPRPVFTTVTVNVFFNYYNIKEYWMTNKHSVRNVMYV